jgi:hypothetical protein
MWIIALITERWGLQKLRSDRIRGIGVTAVVLLVKYHTCIIIKLVAENKFRLAAVPQRR